MDAGRLDNGGGGALLVDLLQERRIEPMERAVGVAQSATSGEGALRLAPPLDGTMGGGAAACLPDAMNGDGAADGAAGVEQHGHGDQAAEERTGGGEGEAREWRRDGDEASSGGGELGEEKEGGGESDARRRLE